jgi:hypothetical protein
VQKLIHYALLSQSFFSWAVGVLDVEAAVGARCTGRLTSCGILSSFVIASVIRFLTLFIAVGDIIANL